MYTFGKNMYLDCKSSGLRARVNNLSEKHAFKSDEEMKKALKVDYQQAKSQINTLANLIKGNPNPAGQTDDDNLTINILQPQPAKNQDDIPVEDDFLSDMIVVGADSNQHGKQSISQKAQNIFGQDLDFSSEKPS